MPEKYKPGQASYFEGERYYTYISYNGMMSRCYNENHRGYPFYGARGIRVCDRWNRLVSYHKGFDNFLEDMGLRPQGLTLNRKDSDRDYEPGNCEWTERLTNVTGRRNSNGGIPLNMIIHPETGEIVKVPDYAEEIGLSYHTLKYRLESRGLWKRGRGVSGGFPNLIEVPEWLNKKKWSR